MKLLDRVEQFITERQLFTRQDKLLVAMSGGLDSTVLATVLLDLGYPIGVAHVNYRLRGEASDGDEAFVRAWARRAGIPAFVHVVTSDGEQSSESNTQLWARNIRYTHFQKILDEYSYTFVVTAHQLDDSLETFLHHFIRGTGLNGLTGIPAKAGSVRRPLSFISRATIQRFAGAEGIAWREDRSNASDDYQRNRIRHQLIPRLRELGLKDHSFGNTLKHLRQTRDLGDKAQVQGLEEMQATVPGTLVALSLAKCPVFVDLTAAVYTVLAPYGGTREQVRQLLSRSDLQLAVGDYLFTRRATLLTVRARMDTSSLPSLPVDKLPFDFVSGGRGYRLREWDAKADATPTQQRIALPTPTVRGLRLRTRLPGDRIQPLGMGGRSKKVQDIFVDKKVPASVRDRHYLLLDAVGDILAIPGIVTSEKGRINSIGGLTLLLEPKFP